MTATKKENYDGENVLGKRRESANAGRQARGSTRIRQPGARACAEPAGQQSEHGRGPAPRRPFVEAGGAGRMGFGGAVGSGGRSGGDRDAGAGYGAAGAVHERGGAEPKRRRDDSFFAWVQHSLRADHSA